MGGLFALLILICCIRRCTRRRQPLRSKVSPSPPMQHQQWLAHRGPPSPPRYGGSPAHGSYYVPPPNVPGYGQYANPRPPPPDYSQRQSYNSGPGVPGPVYNGNIPGSGYNGNIPRGSGTNQDGQRPPMFYGGHSVRYA